MAANDEIPRGWELIANLGGSSGPNPGTGLPAIPFVSHVLTYIEGYYSYLASGAAMSTPRMFTLALNTTDGVYNALPFVAGPSALNSVGPTGGYYAATAQTSWTGKLILPPGVGFTLYIATLGANESTLLRVQGYDL